MTAVGPAGRVFDYVPRLDPRNLAYRAGAVADSQPDHARWWVPSRTVLDQGREGACVGHGVTHEYGASPIRGAVSNALAHAVYRRAQQLDPWPGESYDGTSVHAGMLAGRERGWWSGFRWALSMAELRAALELGPVVIGVEWREGMYEADGGALFPVGRVVGGHCLLVTGYSPRRRVDSYTGPAYRLRNSWGRDWGVNGSAFIAADALNTILFAAGGEAAVPTGRAI